MATEINHFRARVEILIKKKGWTLTEFARRLGKSHQRIRWLMNRGDPKTSVLKEFADALKVSPEELLEEVTIEEYGDAFLPKFDEDQPGA